MGNYILIKDVDFSKVAVDTVTFSNGKYVGNFAYDAAESSALNAEFVLSPTFCSKMAGYNITKIKVKRTSNDANLTIRVYSLIGENLYSYDNQIAIINLTGSHNEILEYELDTPLIIHLNQVLTVLSPYTYCYGKDSNYTEDANNFGDITKSGDIITISNIDNSNCIIAIDFYII